jgi:hypothetical protein
MAERIYGQKVPVFLAHNRLGTPPHPTHEAIHR